MRKRQCTNCPNIYTFGKNYGDTFGYGCLVEGDDGFISEEKIIVTEQFIIENPKYADFLGKQLTWRKVSPKGLCPQCNPQSDWFHERRFNNFVKV